MEVFHSWGRVCDEHCGEEDVLRIGEDTVSQLGSEHIINGSDAEIGSQIQGSVTCHFWPVTLFLYGSYFRSLVENVGDSFALEREYLWP